MTRLRQAVIAARDLDSVVGTLRETLGLGEPFNDPGVGIFGLRNAVFAIGDTFLEVVSPVQPDTSAGRLLDRRGGDCGYMVMFQVEDLKAARERASEHGIREVFEVELDDIAEAHLHPADMSGAIVSISAPVPPASWRWGGPAWHERSVPGRVATVHLAVGDPAVVTGRWEAVLGQTGAAELSAGDGGLVRIDVELDRPAQSVEFGAVTISATRPT